MANLTDEILMAYADGELSTDDRVRVEAILHRDAESRARLGIFQSTGAPLAVLYEKPMLEPPPAHLVAMILNRGPAQTQKNMSRAKPMPRIRWQWLFPDHLHWQMAAASAAMLVAGGSIGWSLHETSAPEAAGSQLVAFDDGHLYATGALQRVLDTTPSGQEARIAGAASDAVTMRVHLTFKTKGQYYCREYEVGAAGHGNHVGLGCRDAAGRWAIQVYVPSTLPSPSSSTGLQTVPAGATTEVAIDTVVDKLIDGDALGRNDEIAAINRRWR